MINKLLPLILWQYHYRANLNSDHLNPGVNLRVPEQQELSRARLSGRGEVDRLGTSMFTIEYLAFAAIGATTVPLQYFDRRNNFDRTV